MKIALISPPIPRRYVRGADEPLSIEYLAAQVRDEHEVRLIDAFGRNLSAAQTLEELSCFSPDIIGVSLVFGGAWNPTLQICREAKGKWPRAVTILGGNTATFMVKELLAHPEIEIVVRGEADLSFPRVVQALKSGTPLSEVQGISFRVGSEVVHNPDQPLVKDLDSLPFPARDLLPCTDQYAKSILTARGCPYGCAYCSASAFWHSRYRPRSVENILAEVALIAALPGQRPFSFGDDCFTLQPERVIRICEALVAMKLTSLWNCTGRIETISDGLLAIMSAAGCRSIFFGVESGSPAILKSLGRRYTPEDVEEVYRACLSNGIRPIFSFIVGLPFETQDDLELTYQLIQKLEGVESGIHILTPFPGTPIAERPSDYALEIRPHHVGDLDLNTGSVINTSNFSAEETEESFRTAMGYSFQALRRTRKFSRIIGNCPDPINL